MPQVQLFDAAGAAGAPASIDDRIFGGPVRAALLHQAVVRQQANARQGTHDTKTRGEVAGSTRKMWRQKGTGRARQGAKRAPHWRHGGVVFGPHPRSHRQEMPRKMRVAALFSAFAVKAQDGKLVLLEDLQLEKPSTKTVAQLLGKVAPGRSTLLVLEAPQPMVQLSVRNLPHVTAITTDNINVYDVLRHDQVVLSVGAARRLEQRYGASGAAGAAGAEE